jgi:Zn-dependent protease
LLLTASVATLGYSTVLHPLLHSAGGLIPHLPAPLATLVEVLRRPWGTAHVSALSRNVRVGVAAALAWMAGDVRENALMVEAEKPDKVFAYYMHVWNIFYACYFLLPALRV